MATRTLKAKYEPQDDAVSRKRAILCHSKNTCKIYYLFEDEVPPVPEPTVAEPIAPVALSVPIPAPAPAAVAASMESAGAIEDVPLKAADILLYIITQKLKKRAEEVPLTKSIKDLVGGKSTLQNKILGDLQLKFTSAPEKGEELPLEELGSALGVGHSGTLGKYTSGLITRLIGGKMPRGFNASAIRGYRLLVKDLGFGLLMC
ncbi:hypothetical protein J3R83DRAFT_5114 [Lanmaoa asiatica]|nr:hypothetical protein J3R83DRAFT_5114 [Lanmaoa asiatica]